MQKVQETAVELYRYTKGDPRIFEQYMGMGETAEPGCGDVLRIYLSTRREVITEIGYTINESACRTSKVCAAAACALAKDKPVLEAYLIRAADIAAQVGDLPEEGLHCAQMAELSLKRAIIHYAGSRGKAAQNNP